MASESEKKKKKSKPAQDEVPEYLIKPEDVQPTLDTSKWPLLLKVRFRAALRTPHHAFLPQGGVAFLNVT